MSPPHQGPHRLWLRPLNASDAARVDRLLDRLTAYSLAVDGVPKMRDAAGHFLTATPPGRDAASKRTFEVMLDQEPVGLVDLIEGFPRKGVAFIGLLAIVEDRHRRGLGRAAFKAVQAYARERFGARTLRLAVVNTNPVEGFWEKMGFRRTGEVRPYEGEARSGLAILMEKDPPGRFIGMTEYGWFDSPRARFVVSPHAVLRCRQGQLMLSSGSRPSTLVLHPDAMPLLIGLAKPRSLSGLMNIPAKIPRAKRPALLRKLISAGAVEVRPQPAEPKGPWWDPHDRAREETTLLQLIQIAHGFTRSAQVSFCVDESGAPVPWLSRPVLDYLFQLDLSGTRVFEYGGGASTYYWVRRCRSVVCVESSRPWYERLRADLAERGSLLLREREQDYAAAILETEDLYDIIVIDAPPRFRSGCAAPALKRLTPGGMIILDDAPFYADAAAALRAAGLIEVDLTGYSPLEDNLQTTALFLTRDFAIPRRHGESPAFPFGSPGFQWEALEPIDEEDRA